MIIIITVLVELFVVIVVLARIFWSFHFLGKVFFFFSKLKISFFKIFCSSSWIFHLLSSFCKSKAVPLSSRAMCKNSNHALNVLRFKSRQPSFNYCMHLKSRCSFASVGFNHVSPFQLTTRHERKSAVNAQHRCGCLCVSPTVKAPSKGSSRLLITCFE